MGRLKSLLLAGVMLAFPAMAEAKTKALLIGVADYDEASGITDLLGPRNDVAILWRALKQGGVDPADVTVLTDNLPAGENFPVAKDLPKAANILAELDWLAETAQKGDTVLIYYSGHGSRQPDNPDEPEDEPEADGMDQVLLPSDVGKYDPIKMSLKNAIVDDVLGRKINAIRARGAFVWAVIDACHSGTVTRGETVTRSVDPVKLGIPPASAVPTQVTRGGTREGTLKARTSPGEGGLVGFYAVESYDEAIERPFTGYNLPMVGEGNTQRMGVFTYLLHRALTRGTAQTYRDLAQEIVSELNMDHTGGKVPPPVFDGDLDAPIPGSDAERLPNSANGILSDGKLTLPVGSFHGYDVGATLALFGPGDAKTPVAHADVTEATAVTAVAENIAWAEGVTAIESGTLSAVVDTPAISFRYVVSPPPATDFTDEATSATVAAAIAESFKGSADTIGIEMGEAGNPDADVLLRVKDNRLWIVRPDRLWVTEAGSFNETPSLALDATPEALAQSVKAAVWSLARAAKLIRVTSALDAAGAENEDIAISASFARAAASDPKAACKTDAVPQAASSASPLSPMLPQAAGNCDYVSIEVTNDGDIDYYVAGFYVDSLGGIAAIPYSTSKTGCVRPLAAGTGKKLSFKLWIDTWDEKAGKPSTTGAENFVVLAIPKEAGAAPRLCALTQPTLSGMQQTREASAGITRGSKARLANLMDGMQGSATRGASAAPEEGGLAMAGRLFVFDVRP